jgi:hypothetical protein
MLDRIALPGRDGTIINLPHYSSVKGKGYFFGKFTKQEGLSV